MWHFLGETVCQYNYAIRWLEGHTDIATDGRIQLLATFPSRTYRNGGCFHGSVAIRDRTFSADMSLHTDVRILSRRYRYVGIA